MPYTYFGDRPVNMADGVALDSGDLAGVVLERSNPLDAPSITFRSLSKRFRVSNHRHVASFSGLTEFSLRSVDDRPLPLQVDGDYIGTAPEASFSVLPSGITVVA
jgi:diacylglycerol kinase family enzyme